MRFTLLSLLPLPLALAPAYLSAQILPPSSGSPSPPTAQSQGSQDQAPSQANGQYGPSGLMGGDFPNIDPTTGVMKRNGETFDLRNNQLLRSQIISFLNQSPPPLAEAQEYQEIFDHMFALMDAQDSDGQRPAEAWALLSTAAGYELDGGHCANIANAIFQAWNAKSNAHAINLAQGELVKQRTTLERQARIFAYGNPLKPRAAGGPQETKDDGEEGQQATQVLTPRLQQVYQRLAEVEAIRAQNIVDRETAIIQAKAEFQVLIGQLFVMRRFDHCRLASAFYRYLFQDSNSSIELNEGSEFGRFFSKGVGTNPTVNALEAAASEAVNKTEGAVESFYTQLNNNQMFGASERVTEAVLYGEYLPVVQMIPAEDRQKVARYMNQTARLIDQIEGRNYNQAEAILDEIDEVATDFTYSGRVRSEIAGQKNLSNLRLMQAQAAMAGGNTAEFNSLFEEAGTIWPTNPNLQEAMSRSGGAIIVEETKNDFDRHYDAGEYRAIFDNASLYLGALNGDDARLDRLNDIISQFTEIQATLITAETYHSRGQSEIAWEITEDLLLDHPSDSSILDANRRYQREVSEFVSALRDAQDAEEKGDLGSALAHYFEAQREYPTSTHARTGINEILAKVLPKD